MGLDAVEIVLEIEDQFGVAISDEEATSVRTVGDLYGVLIAKGVASPMDSPCQSRRVFRLVRDAVRRVADGAPRRLRPGTPLADCLAQQTTKAFWAGLARDTSWRLPELIRPATLESRILSAAAIVGITIWVVISLHPAGQSGSAVLLGAVSGYAVGLIIYGVLRRLTRPACREFPVRNLRELTSSVLHGNHEALADVLGQPVVTNEWQKLRDLIGEQMGLDPREIYPELRLVEDLGMD